MSDKRIKTLNSVKKNLYPGRYDIQNEFVRHILSILVIDAQKLYEDVGFTSLEQFLWDEYGIPSEYAHQAKRLALVVVGIANKSALTLLSHNDFENLPITEYVCEMLAALGFDERKAVWDIVLQRKSNDRPICVTVRSVIKEYKESA